jgi:hypothetical protein
MKNGLLAGVFFGLLVLSACDTEQFETGPLVSQPVSIDAGTAERANVELNIGAGELRVSGGGNKLLDGTIDYNVPRWKPEIISSHNGANATVTVRQPEHGSSLGNHKNKWDLQLSNKILMDLTVNCGAGQAKLDIGDVMLRELQVHIGVGQVDVDLTGKPAHDYEVTVHGGIGQATVRLPQGVGIWASAHGGIGSINVTGLEKHGDHWENDLYDKAKVNVRIEVNGGIGEIRLMS